MSWSFRTSSIIAYLSLVVMPPTLSPLIVNVSWLSWGGSLLDSFVNVVTVVVSVCRMMASCVSNVSTGGVLFIVSSWLSRVGLFRDSAVNGVAGGKIIRGVVFVLVCMRCGVRSGAVGGRVVGVGECSCAVLSPVFYVSGSISIICERTENLL